MSNHAALHRASESLIKQVGHWSVQRWEAHTDGVARAQRVHAVLQHIADISTACEGVSSHQLPTLKPTTAIVDQMRVVLNDAARVVDDENAEHITQLCRALSNDLTRY